MDTNDICKAFCQPLTLHAVPIGYALRTPFRRPDGDPIGIYLRREDSLIDERFRLEDDGQTIGFLETSGLDLDSDSRRDALAEMLKEHDARYDEDEVVIHSPYLLFSISSLQVLLIVLSV